MARFADRLPYRVFPSLGEGGTPLIELPDLAVECGIGALWLKNEGQNPTGSHKDRMMSQAVARALDVAPPGVIAASSGNAGISLAAYAAAAGIPCEVVVTSECAAGFRRFMRLCGARVVATRVSLDRWRYMARRIDEDGLFPVTNFLVPPVGSNPFGVDGLKTIAFEIYEQLDRAVPDGVVVPTSRADLLWGVHAGFAELRAAGLARSLPRLFAVEPFPRISAALADGDYRVQQPGQTRQLSIGGATITHQALTALKRSSGSAVVTSDDAVTLDHRVLADRGIYLELSSASTLTAIRQLSAAGQIGRNDVIVAIATSHGMKDEPGGEPDIEWVAP
jgi:threonine synthase